MFFVWNAYLELTTDRQLGFSVGPIPWTAIDRYAQRHGLDDPDEFAELVALIRDMDAAFLGRQKELSDNGNAGHKAD